MWDTKPGVNVRRLPPSRIAELAAEAGIAIDAIEPMPVRSWLGGRVLDPVAWRARGYFAVKLPLPAAGLAVAALGWSTTPTGASSRRSPTCGRWPAASTRRSWTTAELLTNVAKHSGARHATLEAVHAPGLLRVRVTDDGRGGARPVPAAGCAGWPNASGRWTAE